MTNTIKFKVFSVHSRHSVSNWMIHCFANNPILYRSVWQIKNSVTILRNKIALQISVEKTKTQFIIEFRTVIFHLVLLFKSFEKNKIWRETKKNPPTLDTLVCRLVVMQMTSLMELKILKIMLLYSFVFIEWVARVCTYIQMRHLNNFVNFALFGDARVRFSLKEYGISHGVYVCWHYVWFFVVVIFLHQILLANKLPYKSKSWFVCSNMHSRFIIIIKPRIYMHLRWSPEINMHDR